MPHSRCVILRHMLRLGLLLLLTYLPIYATACEDLRKLKLPHATVEKAEIVAAGASTLPAVLVQNAWAGSSEVPAPRLPAFCRVLLGIHAVPDSRITVEVRLPTGDWNDRFIAVGNGGGGGQINWRAMSRPLSRGYAVASTDTGHTAAGTTTFDHTFAVGHPEKVTDFAHRAVHEMAVNAKAVVAAFYGRAPKYSYWNGSSTGGRQGLKSAQMYPGDFDGIVAGAPVFNSAEFHASSYRIPLAIASGAVAVASEKLKLLNAAVVRQCDVTDGVRDNVIGDPLACRFDPASVSELTAAELAMVRTMYEPLRHPTTNAEIFPGFTPGSELGWSFSGPSLEGPPDHFLVLNKPGFDKAVNLATDVDRWDKADAGQMSAATTDIRAFFKRGGKLMMVHGWSDPQIAPLGSIRYYRQVTKDLGDVRSSFRLFMVPGMGHSRGGVGVNDFDTLTAIEQWVEQGTAPDRILGSRLVDGKAVYSRPLCSWPQVAKYNGSGDPDDAASYACVSPAAQ
jgi:feruloyl esterase